MVLRFRLLWADLVPRPQPSFDLRANPANNSYVWLPWLEDDEEELNRVLDKVIYPLKMTMGELEYYMNLNTKALKLQLWDVLESLSSSYVYSVGGML